MVNLCLDITFGQESRVIVNLLLVTDPEVVAGDVIDPGVETEDGIVTGVMTGEGETGVTPEITGS